VSGYLLIRILGCEMKWERYLGDRVKPKKPQALLGKSFDDRFHTCRYTSFNTEIFSTANSQEVFYLGTCNLHMALSSDNFDSGRRGWGLAIGKQRRLRFLKPVEPV
jgi:hypothetical protein